MRRLQTTRGIDMNDYSYEDETHPALLLSIHLLLSTNNRKVYELLNNQWSVNDYKT